MPLPAVELVGYVASLLVAISLTMSNVRRLRLVNLAGAVTFAIYGALVRAWPVLAVNLFITGVNLHFLRQMARRSDLFTLLPTTGADGFVQQFLRFHDEDLRRFFPQLDPSALHGAHGALVLRNLLPVGLFLYRDADDPRSVEVLVDYVIADYRDQKNAEFVYRTLGKRFAEAGKRAFTTRTTVDAHRRYLLRQGFQESPPGHFQKPFSH